jgi:small multidrug resistance pump
MEWVYLVGAILIEIAATLALRVASDGRRSWYAGVITGYVASFGLLSLALHEGLGIGVAYGVWTAVGVALTAIASRRLFAEPLTPVMGLGIALIAVGVVLLELGAQR